MRQSLNLALAAILYLLIGTNQSLLAQPSTAKSSSESFTIENYYKVKWGFADEFINLWKINHYPLLKKAQNFIAEKIPAGILK
jgi:hypothetical protein